MYSIKIIRPIVILVFYNSTGSGRTFKNVKSQ